jgi:hypothetical protein
MNMQFWSVAVRERQYGVHERGCDILSFVINGEVHNLVTCAATGRSLMLLKSGGLREGHGVTTWTFGNMAEFAGKQRKAEGLCVEITCSRTFGNSDF